MAKLDRYILSQLSGPFAVFALILIGVYWVGRAIGLFDQLVGNGHSVGVFIELMILFFPQVVAIVLPVVAFAAAIFVSNRMHSESEMVVMQAAGLPPKRIMRPFLYFSILVAIFASILSHYLLPLSQSQLVQRQSDLSRDMVSRLITEGKFLHPADGVTFFVRDVGDDGSLNDIFLHDRRLHQRDLTYTASKAIVLTQDDDVRLVMFNGVIQVYDETEQLLSKIEFDDFVFDIGTLTGTRGKSRLRMYDFSTLAALFPTPGMIVATGYTEADFKYAAHARLEEPLRSLVLPLLGMAVLSLGGFSRFGVVRQIFAAVLITVVLAALSGPFREIVRRDISLWWMYYASDIIAAALAFHLIRVNSNRRRISRSIRNLFWRRT